MHASISRRTNKAAARACHRRYWPETNVGASAARDCAARAALDLTGAEDAPATLARNHRISHRYCTTFRAGAFPVGAGLPAIGPQGFKVSFQPPPRARNTPICPNATWLSAAASCARMSV
ncbi:hypothetical protein FPB55_00735 [Pseudomonas sp. BJP69]|nr:hypothetical protein FPB55_00735 [Pseudomonas sp. BJP69]